MQLSSKGASSGDPAVEGPQDLKSNLEPVKLQGKTKICKA